MQFGYILSLLLLYFWEEWTPCIVSHFKGVSCFSEIVFDVIVCSSIVDRSDGRWVWDVYCHYLCLFFLFLFFLCLIVNCNFLGKAAEPSSCPVLHMIMTLRERNTVSQVKSLPVFSRSLCSCLLPLLVHRRLEEQRWLYGFLPYSCSSLRINQLLWFLI